jgi:hypothetical protein
MATTKKTEESAIQRAMSIERLKPVQDGVYVCTNAKTKKYEVVPLENVKVVVNGTQKPLGEVLENIISAFETLRDAYLKLNK